MLDRIRSPRPLQFVDVDHRRLELAEQDTVVADAHFLVAPDDAVREDLEEGGDHALGRVPVALVGEDGGRRFSLTSGGSVEGGFEELVESRLSRDSKSETRFSKETTTVRMAAWASGGTVSRSDSGIGG
jgi:hypothetical protein